jgi:non-heme chloroperoxidase
MRRVSVNGVQLVVDRGEAAAVVFVHGMMCSGRFFARQIDRFAAGKRVIVPDLRGHGESEKPSGGHTVAGYAEDLRVLLECLEVSRPVMVGWLMGAMVAYEYLRASGSRSLRAW